MGAKGLLGVSVLMVLATIGYWWVLWTTGGPDVSLKLLYTVLTLVVFFIMGILPLIRPEGVKDVPERLTK
jgi:hypothetical protein